MESCNKCSFIFLLILFNSVYDADLKTIPPNVTIIGAGPAGIAAATRLFEHGFNVMVLEAESRLGGRINSVKFGDAYVDLGAEWCHGQEDNVVYDLVKDLNILQHTNPMSKVYHSSGEHIDELGTELMSLMSDIYEPDGHRNQKEGKTVGDYCIEKYRAKVFQKYENNTDKLQIALPALEYFHHLVLSSEGAFSWFEPSAQSDYKDCKGDLNLNWDGKGYKTVLDVLIKKDINNRKHLGDRILFNKEVTKIIWRKNTKRSGVTIECSDNSQYHTDHVIFTPSIGVLKERHETLFEPQLPLNKREAIKNIGFGAVMKMAMHFPERWWEDDLTGFSFIWSDEDKKHILSDFPFGPARNGRSWITELFAVMPVERNNNVLIAWLTGELIPAIEMMSDEILINGTMYVFNKFLGREYSIRRPDKFIRTLWYSNPHFRGSYSFQTVACRRNHVTAEVDLAEPLENNYGMPFVHFAGEASHPYYYSTVHGAIETGYREADRIISFYRPLNKLN